MQGGTTGFCKYGGANETLALIEVLKQINENTRCHTLDRDNMHAQFECGIGGDDPEAFKASY